MHLTQAYMENFKSFDRKLTVPFESGFTGITVPTVPANPTSEMPSCSFRVPGGLNIHW